MIALLTITLLVASAAAVPVQQSEIETEWMAFKLKFRNGGAFGDDEMRRDIFESTYRYVVAHNAEADQGLHTYRVGINQFADMTD
ncbi:unnamed protein product, partial [Medioppia subpectinata]